MTAYIDAPAKGYSLGMKQKLGIAIGVRRLIKQYAEQGTAFKLVIFCKKSSHQVKVLMAGLIVLRIFSQNNDDGGC